jgi:hypothetical protein
MQVSVLLHEKIPTSEYPGGDIDFGSPVALTFRGMPKDLQDFINDRLSPLGALSTASRLGSPSAEPPDKPSADVERDYLNTCQKLEQLIERKQHAQVDTSDIAHLHQELGLIGSRIQREPKQSSHEEDYLSVLKRIKESLWKKIEAEDLKGEFQKLHFELLNLGHKLGFERTLAIHESNDEFSPDEMNLSDVERQIAELQAQIRSLHNNH